MIDTKLIKVGDTVVFESTGHVRCEATVTALENNLGQLWLYVYNPEGFQSTTLKGCKRHSIPETRVLEHRPGIVVPTPSRVRTRTRERPIAIA